MKIMQLSFTRITDRINLDGKGERELLLKLVVNLYNLQSNIVHTNQITNTFMPKLDQ